MEKKTEEKTDDLEDYTLDREDILTLALLQSELEKASVSTQLLKERFERAQERLSIKYSKNGEYELVGELDMQKGTGKRRKAK